jgi:hypothetical protein
MAKRKIFPSCSVPPRTTESKEEKQSVSPQLTAKRLQAVPLEASTYAISTDQNLAWTKNSILRSIDQ